MASSSEGQSPAPSLKPTRLCHAIYILHHQPIPNPSTSRCSGPRHWTGNDQVAKSGCTLDTEGMWLTTKAVVTLWFLALAT